MFLKETMNLLKDYKKIISEETSAQEKIINLLLLTLMSPIYIGAYLMYGMFVIIKYMFYFNFMFPFFSIISSLVDSICGGKMKNYKNNKLTKYHIPLLTYYFWVLPIMLSCMYLSNFLKEQDYFNNYYIYLLTNVEVLYIIITVIFLLIFYFGMWKRLKDIEDNNYYIETLKKHRKFLNLSFIPLTFIVTSVGLMTAFNDVDINIIDIGKILENIFNTNISNNIFLVVIIFIILLYVASLPIQILALFINHIFQYFVEEGSVYKKIIKKVYDF
ncbi:MAG: hypothetical protein ACK5LC_05345 [Coprobacillaceae bacterium]